MSDEIEVWRRRSRGVYTPDEIGEYVHTSKKVDPCEFHGRHRSHPYKKHASEDGKPWWCPGRNNSREIETVDPPDDYL